MTVWLLDESSYVVPANAGTHKPCYLCLAHWSIPSVTTNASGYGSLRSQGRRKSLDPSLRGAKRRSNLHFLCGEMDCFAPLAMTVWLLDEPSYVVPANAGTHNHRRSMREKVVATATKTRGHGVCVAAFAGTTNERCARWLAMTSAAPCTLSRHRPPPIASFRERLHELLHLLPYLADAAHKFVSYAIGLLTRSVDRIT